MLKTSHKLKKIFILSCMCSTTFYLGSQIMTYTEAAFTHTTKVEGTISAAIIFPKTVNQLKDQAEQHKQIILYEYGEMKSKLAVTTTEEIEQAIVVWKQGREKIASEKEALQKVYNSIEDPYKQIQEESKVNKGESFKQVSSYVNEGFHIIKEKYDYVEKEFDLPKIDEQIQKFQQLLIDETKRKAEEQKKLEENKKLEEQIKLEESKKLEEKVKLEESKKLEEQKKLEESKKLEEQKKIETDKQSEKVEHEKFASVDQGKQEEKNNTVSEGTKEQSTNSQGAN
ncbi:hypothetical protein IIM_00507 [Bacillus cereus VD107]|nr:hypothetical protein IIM_00507 [Bacillus cereus VD107]